MTTKPLSRSIPETLPHAHVVSKAHDLHVLGHCHADGGLHPAADAGLHVLVLPVTGDDLARLAESGSDEAVLAVAVCSLIKVHEVHVDLFVWNLASLDLSLLTEIRKSEKGSVEIKLMDRSKVLEQLAGMADQGDERAERFLEALLKGMEDGA